MLANLRLGTFSQLTMHNFSIHRVFLLFFLFPHTLRESSRNIFPCKAHEKGEKTRLANNKNGNWSFVASLSEVKRDQVFINEDEFSEKRMEM